jgi:hypothetical protein
MKEVWYEIIATNSNNNVVYISNKYKDDGMIGIRLTMTSVSMNKKEAYMLMNYITEFFNVFRQLRLIRTESIYNKETEETDYVYQIEKEVIR